MIDLSKYDINVIGEIRGNEGYILGLRDAKSFNLVEFDSDFIPLSEYLEEDYSGLKSDEPVNLEDVLAEED